MWRMDFAPKIFVYPALGGSGWVAGPPATYTVAPAATIAGSTTDLANPIGVALDSNRNIYVAEDDAERRVRVSGAGRQQRQDEPTTTIRGSNTALNHPLGVALDSTNNIYVANQGPPPDGLFFPGGNQHRPRSMRRPAPPSAPP